MEQTFYAVEALGLIIFSTFPKPSSGFRGRVSQEKVKFRKHPLGQLEIGEPLVTVMAVHVAGYRAMWSRSFKDGEAG